MTFSKQLITWYLENKRDLPWRKTTNPYLIWLSEVILQQTKVAQGLPYFLAFSEKFPSIFELANAEEQEVLKLWQGLGYYSRARNLHSTAKHIAIELNGLFPDNYKQLLTLKGVGEYTAAAIASFSYNEVTPVVDGNVYRVLSRYFGIETDISASFAKKEFTNIASKIIDKKQPALFNQAIMEFGALQCTPKNPDCAICPLQKNCVAKATNQVSILPKKEKKIKIQKRYLHYLLVLDSENKSFLNQRTEKGIWHNLYELPVIEAEKKESEKVILNYIQKKFENFSSITHLASETILHKLSHQHLYIQFWKVTTNTKIKNGCTYKELLDYPVPIVLHNFLERNSF